MVTRETFKRGKIGRSFKGLAYSFTSQHGEVTCSWPSKPGKARTALQQQNMDMFRDACIAMKLMPGAFLEYGRKSCIGKPMLPRDALLAALYGKGGTWIMPSGRVIRSMATRVDMSSVMDNIAWRKFSMLVRYEDLWEGLDPPDFPAILAFDEVTGPVWIDASGIGSIPIWQRPIRNNLINQSYNCQGTKVVASDSMLIDMMSCLHEIPAGKQAYMSVYRVDSAGVIQEIMADFPTTALTTGGWQFIEEPVPTPFFMTQGNDYAFCLRVPAEGDTYQLPIQRGALMQMVTACMPWQGILAWQKSNPAVGDLGTLLTDTQNTSMGFRVIG